jgi:putative endonuclease
MSVAVDEGSVMASWFVYLIECEGDTIYTGIATDVAARYAAHAAGKGARYTRSRPPRRLLCTVPAADRSEASKLEYWIKKLSPVQKREIVALVLAEEAGPARPMLPERK